MKSFLSFPLLCFFLFCSPGFSQETEIRKLLSIKNTKTDIIKETDKNTVTSILSGFSEDELENFRKTMVSFKGVREIIISPLENRNNNCVIVFDKEIKKGAMVKFLQTAGIENVSIDEVNCKIKDYLKIMEEKKKNK